VGERCCPKNGPQGEVGGGKGGKNKLGESKHLCLEFEGRQLNFLPKKGGGGQGHEQPTMVSSQRGMREGERE